MSSHRYWTVLAILAVALLGAAPAAVADGYFLDVPGADGDANEQGHEGWIEVLSFSHSAADAVDASGRPTGRVELSPLYVTKLLDRSSVPLYDFIFNAEPRPEVILELTRLGPDRLETYYRITLEDAAITHIGTSGAQGQPTETIAFSYQTITLEDLLEHNSTTYSRLAGATVQTDFPGGSILLPPSPNPMVATAEFRFALPKASHAVLAVFDVRGRRVRELHNGWVPAATTVATWDGTDAAGRRVGQGMYIARLEYPGMVVTQRLAVVR